MSKPRETRSSPREITPLDRAPELGPGHEALRQLAVRVLTQYSGSAGDGAALAAAARRAYDELARVSAPLIGQVGVDALTARAVHLAQREYPWLGEATGAERTHEPFAQVLAILERQHPPMATSGTAAVFAAFAGLLVTFIGERLTTSLLGKAWPDAFPDARTQET